MWIRQEEAFHLKGWFGFPFQFTSITHLSLAARLRVIRSERVVVDREVAGIREALGDAVRRFAEWSSWYEEHVFLHLREAEQHFEQWGMGVGDIEDSIADNLSERQRVNKDHFIRKKFQHTALEISLAHSKDLSLIHI